MSNVSGRIVLMTLAGIAAGLLTWFFSDLSGLIHLPNTSGPLDRIAAMQQSLVCAFFGAMIGLLLGIADMIASGAQAQWLRIVGYGLLIGAVAGFVGITLGMPVYNIFHITNVTNAFAFLLNTIARASGWAFIGALAGAVEGIRKWSGRTLRNGIIGGFIGGLLGGTVFEASIYLLPFVPQPAVVSRLLGFVITGGLIGLFIGLVQQLLKEAWVRIVVGKNEGREVLIEKELSTIGRSELSDIGLFGDMSVAKNHAQLIAVPNGGYMLRDVSGQGGTVAVNEKRLSNGEQAPVKNGDTLRIGGKTLIFFERLTKERTVTEKDGRRPRPATPAGTPAPAPMPAPFAPVGPTMGAHPTLGATVVNGMNSAPAPAGGVGSRLVAITGPHAGQTFPVRSGAIIGRDAGADIPIPGDTSASRRHARIVQEALSLAVEDAGSTNGTFVNGQRITRQSLVPGDTILVGGTSLRLE